MIILQADLEWHEVAPVADSNHPGPSEAGSEAQSKLPPSYHDAMVRLSPLPVPSINVEPPRSRSREHIRVHSRSRTTSTSRIETEGPPSPMPTARTGPIMYTFYQKTFNSMVLQSSDLISLYHISIHHNCFIPSSYITVVRRGGNESGDYMGQFEIGLSTRKDTVAMDGQEKLLSTVLAKAGSKSARNWQWRWDVDESHQLSWTYESPVKYCYSLRGFKAVGSDAPLLATYTPLPLTPRADGRPSPAVTLKLYPEGVRHFDHILMSALVIERQRLTPA